VEPLSTALACSLICGQLANLRKLGLAGDEKRQ
jgi:hypothetical protein